MRRMLRSLIAALLWLKKKAKKSAKPWSPSSLPKASKAGTPMWTSIPADMWSVGIMKKRQKKPKHNSVLSVSVGGSILGFRHKFTSVGLFFPKRWLDDKNSTWLSRHPRQRSEERR